MSADAATLPCPLCSHTGIFDSVQSLRDRLINVSTNKILCPVCQEEVCGLDKLTIHLFTHVKLMPSKTSTEKSEPKSNEDSTSEPKFNSQCTKTQPKKLRPTSASKNKPPPPSSSASTPVKFVKIYPKLPVISLNTMPVINVSGVHLGDENMQNRNPICLSTVQSEASVAQADTRCNVCGLQFVNFNILNIHRSLIHNIKDDSNATYTRYDCHLCSKNFKMRGSLMVHLRVAHYGFSSSTNNSSTLEKASSSEDRTTDQVSKNKLTNFERNDNKQWQCDVCRKCFTTKYFLKKHKRLHTGETPYACLQCNKTFTFQQSYHKHLLYHNDEKPHTCSYCGRAFKELSTLHNHQRIHTGEKPFSCETCGKCFRQRVSYLVHRRIHTGVMPYKCTACEKSFRYKVSQRTHKCQAQPPGTVIRQAGDLVEKLKKKNSSSKSVSEDLEVTEVIANINTDIQEISKENVELAIRGAKISLEDMESECFSLITEAFSENNNEFSSTRNPRETEQAITNNIFNSNIENFISSIPTDDENVPSPSEILKNLCLSKEDDYINILQENKDKNHKDNLFL